MSAFQALTDAQVIEALGRRLAARRIERGLTQAQLAAATGLSKRTVERLESGQVAAQLSAFVKVCRALDLLAGLDAWLPEPGPSPMALLKMARARPRRARARPAKPAGGWSWGDDE